MLNKYTNAMWLVFKKSQFPSPCNYATAHWTVRRRINKHLDIQAREKFPK